jgi:MraZ protein
VGCGGIKWGSILKPQINRMFIGEYHISIDDKGRVSVPVKYREALKSGAVVTRGLDTSLFLMTHDAWVSLSQKLADLPLGAKEARAFTRFMLAGAMEVELDRAGRFLIPEYLRNFAGLKKGAVIVGVQNRLEIWDAGLWAAYTKEAEVSAEIIAQNLGV